VTLPDFFQFFGLLFHHYSINYRLVSINNHEQLLLQGLATNEQKAIETIYRDNYGIIQSFILKNNGYPEDARDVFQEAMIILYEKATSESFELTCQIKTYLYSVCRRLWLKRLQQTQRHTATIENVVETITVDDDMAIHEKKDADFILMESALAKIGEPCKGLLESFYLQKKTMPEIAKSFGYTNADNAKTQKYKCLVRLKKLFFAQYKNGG
jgi:RNA polymerase sigma factor (sigma-70 family)